MIAKNDVEQCRTELIACLGRKVKLRSTQDIYSARGHSAP